MIDDVEVKCSYHQGGSSPRLGASRVCRVRCVVWGAWCTVRGVRCAVYGAWCTVYVCGV